MFFFAECYLQLFQHVQKNVTKGAQAFFVIGKHLSLLTICHKGFQSHFIAPNFFTLAISNSLKRLATKPNLCCFNKSLCSFSNSLNHCKPFWYSKNSCKELANDYVSLASKRSIVWEIVIATSSPCLAYIRPNNAKCINIHIAYIKKNEK